MTEEEKNQLQDLLDKLMNSRAPCKGCGCKGYQNCEFGINGAYGEECSIEVVKQAMEYY